MSFKKLFGFRAGKREHRRRCPREGRSALCEMLPGARRGCAPSVRCRARAMAKGVPFHFFPPSSLDANNGIGTAKIGTPELE